MLLTCTCELSTNETRCLYITSPISDGNEYDAVITQTGVAIVLRTFALTHSLVRITTIMSPTLINRIVYNCLALPETGSGNKQKRVC